MGGRAAIRHLAGDVIAQGSLSGSGDAALRGGLARVRAGDRLCRGPGQPQPHRGRHRRPRLGAQPLRLRRQRRAERVGRPGRVRQDRPEQGLRHPPQLHRRLAHRGGLAQGRADPGRNRARLCRHRAVQRRAQDGRRQRHRGHRQLRGSGAQGGWRLRLRRRPPAPRTACCSTPHRPRPTDRTCASAAPPYTGTAPLLAGSYSDTLVITVSVAP